MQAVYAILKSPEHNAVLVGKAEAKLILFAKGLNEMPHDVQNTLGVEWLLDRVKMAHGARVVQNGLPRASCGRYTESDVDDALREWRHYFVLSFYQSRPITRKRLRDAINFMGVVK